MHRRTREEAATSTRVRRSAALAPTLNPKQKTRLLLLEPLLLTVGLWGRNARAVCDQQIHHRVPSHVHRGGRHHVAKGDGAAGSHVGCDGARGTLVVAVGAHVPLELGGRFAVDAAQVADQYASGPGSAEAAGALLPLLAVMLLGVDAQVRQRGEG